MRLDYQTLLKSPPPKFLAGSAPGLVVLRHGVRICRDFGTFRLFAIIVNCSIFLCILKSSSSYNLTGEVLKPEMSAS